MGFLALAAIFVTGSIVPAYGPAKGDLEILGIGLLSAGAGAVLGLQKGIALGATYKNLLGVLSVPTGATFGAFSGMCLGGFAGTAIAFIGRDILQAIRERAEREKFEKAKKEAEAKKLNAKKFKQQ